MRIHHIFRWDTSPGFADVLAGSLDVSYAVRTVNRGNGVEAVSVIPSGEVSRDAFAAILQSPKVADAMKRLTADYDVLLLDSPPVLSVTDALLLAPIVDGVILVLRTGSVGERDAKRAKERIQEAGGRIVGIVMNCFNERLHGPAFTPHYDY